MRRVSTITSAPSAPSARSRHMKPKRSWPGVPNRYSLMSSSIVMQPKSSATVVVVFSGTWPVRSASSDAVVMAASVRSGVISEMDATAVVLPTPKPPAMTILTGVGVRGSTDGFKAADDPLDHGGVAGEVGGRPADDDVPERGQVRHEDPGHTDVQPEDRGDLRHRHGLR